MICILFYLQLSRINSKYNLEYRITGIERKDFRKDSLTFMLVNFNIHYEFKPEEYYDKTKRCENFFGSTRRKTLILVE